MGSPEMEIGRLQGAQRELQARIERNEKRFEDFVKAIDARHARMDSKLDRLLSQQQIAISVREEIEERSDKRAKKISGWTATGVGVIFVVVGELVRWYLRANWGH